jgi:beta-lactamase superfamily II metal-dependent hydrolase
MARKPRPTASTPASAALTPPPGGAAIRMYRIGHGDCFLIAFAGQDPDKPAHVLIDCGYKPGSPGKLAQPTTARDVAADILAVTGGFVDIAVVTHEHQDHVNGLTPGNFPGLKVGKVWFAWTESARDDVANQLRKKFHDRLLGLIDARANLLGIGQLDRADALTELLSLELGGDSDDVNIDVDPYGGRQHLGAAGKDPGASANKLAMKYLSDCGQGEPDYLYPHSASRPIPGAASARAFVLGPPRDVDKIDDLDPVGDETFGDDDSHHGLGVGVAAGGMALPRLPLPPFAANHVIPLDRACGSDPFFRSHYGGDPVDETLDGAEVATNAMWRRLNAEDAADAGALALAMNNATNNASLVLAFELSKGGKVLLFAGDAQAGNWRSWSEAAFDDDGVEVTARDLLGRTVLYKVGHHGSHNATLNGSADAKHACLAWMANGRHAGEFTAMITAVEAWAHQKPKPDWNHPLPAIKRALEEKTGGRVLQTDTDLAALRPSASGAAGWQDFLRRVKETPTYFDLMIEP